MYLRHDSGITYVFASGFRDHARLYLHALLLSTRCPASAATTLGWQARLGHATPSVDCSSRLNGQALPLQTTAAALEVCTLNAVDTVGKKIENAT